MSELTLNKTVRPYVGSELTCSCGTKFISRGYSHKYCDECGKIALSRGIKDKKMERFFPVVYEPLRYVVEHLLDKERTDADLAREERRKHEGFREVMLEKAPCDGCRFFVLCRDKLLACKSFYEWSNADTKRGVWGERVSPNRLWYEKSFPTKDLPAYGGIKRITKRSST